MKSVFAIKRDALLRLIEASEDYKREIAPNAAPIDFVIEGSALVELEYCRYIIRVPVTDLSTIEWSAAGYVLIDIAPLPAVTETISSIVGDARMDELRIAALTPDKEDIEIEGMAYLKAIKYLHIVITGDVGIDDRLQAVALSVVPIGAVSDVGIEGKGKVAPLDIIGIAAKETIEALGSSVALGTVNLVGIGAVEGYEIEGYGSIEGAAATGIEITQDVDMDMHGSISVVYIHSFSVKQDLSDLTIRLRIDRVKAKCLAIVQNVDEEGNITPEILKTVTLATVENIAMEGSCVMSIERSAVFGDYPSTTFGALAAKTFNELRRIVV